MLPPVSVNNLITAPRTTAQTIPLQTLAAHAVPESEPADPDALEITDWTQLVERVHAGEPAAMEELYAIFDRGIRYFLLRSLGPDDIDDKVHDCFLIVTQAIRNGDLREPDRLMGFVRTVVKRQIAGSIDVAVQQRRTRVEFDDTILSVSDWREDPERTMLAKQRAEIARKVLSSVSRRDRDILDRFYVQEQTQEKICKARQVKIGTQAASLCQLASN